VTNEIVQNYKRFNNKTILPNHQGHTDHQNQINTKLQDYGNSSGQNQGIIERIQNNSLQNVHVKAGTKLWTTYRMSATNFRRIERGKLISNEFKQGNWPVNKSDLVNE